MKYGMNLLLWTDQLDESMRPLLERLKKMGFDGVEVPVFDTTPEQCATWAKWLDELGLERTTVTARGEAENPISADDRTRELGLSRNKRAVDCTEALGASLMVGPFHSALGVFTGHGPTAEEWKRGVDSMRQLAEHAARRQVTLGVEYLNRFECYLLNSAADTVRFLKEVGHPQCRMIYDTFHANIEEKNISASIDTAAPHLAHVHISENDRGTPGEGHVPWLEVFHSLARVGYEGWLTIEAFGMSLPSLVAATKIWRKMYRDEEQLAKDGLGFMKFHWEDNPAVWSGLKKDLLDRQYR